MLLKHTPWGKATAPQWRDAVRNSTAMCLALFVAYIVQLDEPFWAMTSAAIVSFPTVGGVISKSLGRISGSLIGAFAAIYITGNTLNDPWLFILSMALWLAFCTWFSNQFYHNAAYAFALSGYTAAIIAFPMINITDLSTLWYLAQARVSEVITGILCGGIMMMILPSTSDGNTLVTSLQNMQERIADHAALLWKSDHSGPLHEAHSQLIEKTLTIDLLRIQAFWSHYRFRRNNALLNALLHQQLRLISMTSGIRRLLENWPEQPAHIAEFLADILEEINKANPDKDRIHALLTTLEKSGPQDYKSQAFQFQLQAFCQLYLDNLHWISRIDQSSDVASSSAPEAPKLARYSDQTESLFNAARTFTVILLAGSWGLMTQWSSASGALTLAAISCVLYSSSPSPLGTMKLLMRTLLLLCLFSFVFKFGLMIQLTELWQFLLILFPLLLTMQLLKLQQPRYASQWSMLIVFLGSFISVTNPPTYDFADFLNGNLAKIIGVAMAWFAFALLRPSSDIQKGKRIVRSLRAAFIDQLQSRPNHSEHHFESFVYHLIGQYATAKNETAKRWLLRYGVVFLNSSHVIWELRHWHSRSPAHETIRKQCVAALTNIIHLKKGIQQPALNNCLEKLRASSEELTLHPEPEAKELAALLWRLFCVLSPLAQPLTQAEAKTETMTLSQDASAS